MAKRQRPHTPNMFEPEMKKIDPAKEWSPPPIKDPCPRCGSKSQRSLRPEEHGGRTHYCVGDCRDGDDMFYFTPDPVAAPRPKLVATPAAPADEEAVPCPQCGHPAQTSKRAKEHQGKTHYCVVCRGDEPGEPFRFTPGTSSPTPPPTPTVSPTPPPTDDRTPEPPETQPVTASLAMPDVPPAPVEVVKTVEPRTAEPEQLTLIDAGRPWEEHWRGMPEFVQRDRKPFQSVTLNFETREAMEAFAKLIEQPVTLDTDSLWFPRIPINDFAKTRYVDKDAK